MTSWEVEELRREVNALRAELARQTKEQVELHRLVSKLTGEKR